MTEAKKNVKLPTMKFLKQLPRGQHDTLIRLPYRVGLWVSESDATGGAKAEREEAQALENILVGFTQEVFGSELVQHIMSETVAQKDRWPEWEQGLDRVPQECREALEILHDRADPKEINAFKQRLIEIGEAVALAFREKQAGNLKDKVKLYGLYYLGVLKAKARRQNHISLERYLNISPAEMQALQRISKMLGVKYL